MIWVVTMSGLKSTPWENARIKLKVVLDPYSIPQLIFETFLFHPNFSPETGEICTEIMSGGPDTFKITEVLVYIQHLLWEPELEDCINIEAAQLYIDSPLLFTKKALLSCAPQRIKYEGTSRVSQIDNFTSTAVSFDDYHNRWKLSSTTMIEILPKGMIQPRNLLHFKTLNTYPSKQEVKLEMKQMKQMKLGIFTEKLLKESGRPQDLVEWAAALPQI